jgi:hypothetical protein
VLTFQDLIPPSLAVAQACAARGDEESVRSVLEVFSDLSICPMPVLKPYMGPVSCCNCSTCDCITCNCTSFTRVTSNLLLQTGLHTNDCVSSSICCS